MVRRSKLSSPRWLTSSHQPTSSAAEKEMGEYIRPRNLHTRLPKPMDHIHSRVHHASSGSCPWAEAGVEEEIYSQFQVSSFFRDREWEEQLCISIITSAEGDGSMRISSLCPLQGVLFVAVTGSQPPLAG
jgi:hypothetical protein